MSEIITAPKKGAGTEDNPARPDTNAKWWQVIKEREDEFDIEILQDETGVIIAAETMEEPETT